MNLKPINFLANPAFKYCILVITLAVYSVPMVLLLLNPDADLESKSSFCPLKALSGFPCAGCGMTKAIAFLYAGEIKKSLEMHALAIPILLYCSVLTFTLFTGNNSLAEKLLSKKLLLAGIAIFFVYFAIRLLSGQI